MCFLLASTSHVKMLGQNHFAEPNQHVLTVLHQEFTVQCTDGVALRCIAMVSDLSTISLVTTQIFGVRV
jgi:hypothetical protein